MEEEEQKRCDDELIKGMEEIGKRNKERIKKNGGWPDEPKEEKCKYCYGKGYSSQMAQEIGHDDFGGEFYSKTIFRDIPCKKCGNYFRTLEEAEQKLEEVKQILY